MKASSRVLVLLLVFAVALSWLEIKNRGSVTLTEQQANQMTGTLLSERTMRVTAEAALREQIERNRVLSTVCTI